MRSRCKAPTGVLLVPDELLNLSAVSRVDAYLKAGSLPKNKTNVTSDMKRTRQMTFLTKPILKSAWAGACAMVKETQPVSKVVTQARVIMLTNSIPKKLNHSR